MKLGFTVAATLSLTSCFIPAVKRKIAFAVIGEPDIGAQLVPYKDLVIGCKHVPSGFRIELSSDRWQILGCGTFYGENIRIDHVAGIPSHPGNKFKFDVPSIHPNDQVILFEDEDGKFYPIFPHESRK